MYFRLAATAVIALGLASCASIEPVPRQTYSFGLWGDMPYKKAGDDPKLPAVLHSINQSDVSFTLFDGDIKDGSSKCSDDVYTDALKMFASMDRPVVYIPGDNEWTDCHRLNNGGYDAIERLGHLRRVMFPTTNSHGRTTMALEHQGKPGEKFVENIRFEHGGIVFAGFNVPGSNNNLVLNAKDCGSKSARDARQCDAANAEHLERDAANALWLEQTFHAARKLSAPGVVLVFQGDPGFDLPETEDLDESKAPNVSGYRNFIARIVKQSETYPGQVLLVHGDTHFFKVDKPLYSPTRLLPNLTRVQTFGSPSLHWVKVQVDPASHSVFRMEPVIVDQP